MALRAVPDHPKFAEFKALLKVPRYAALGCLESIWHFTGRFTPQGNIGKYSDSAIEAWCEWQGEPGALIAALVQSHWIDDDPEHRLLVHDWATHADKATKNSLNRTKQDFCTPTVRTPYPLPVPEPVPEPEPEPEPVVSPSALAAEPAATPSVGKTKRAQKLKALANAEEAIEHFQSKPAFQKLDVGNEYYRAQAWCEGQPRGRICTERFFTSWLITAAKEQSLPHLNGNGHAPVRAGPRVNESPPVRTKTREEML